MEDANEIGARVDGIDVQEHAIPAEAPVQVVGEAAGVTGGIISAVADEDAWWHEGIGARLHDTPR